eukprot:scaffold21260_cov20-Tisochrysis_lutea.AAC.1
MDSKQGNSTPATKLRGGRVYTPTATLQSGRQHAWLAEYWDTWPTLSFTPLPASHLLRESTPQAHTSPTPQSSTVKANRMTYTSRRPRPAGAAW